jgi:hypothetical protein
MKRIVALFTLTISLMALPGFAQDKPTFTDPMFITTQKDAKYFDAHFRKGSMSGTVTVPKHGLAVVPLVDFQNAPKGFAVHPTCTLTHHGKPADIRSWEETGRTDFFSFKAKPGMEIEWTCSGWLIK